MSAITWQWILVILSGILLLIISPLAKDVSVFFRGAKEKTGPVKFGMLTASLVISWIFAKSITNAANLGAEFGIVGGVAYGAYYFSFVVAGLVIFQLREKGNFQSLHHFLESKFGRKAAVIFSLVIAIRLFNEVWSNTAVIGSYFGERGSLSYVIAIMIFTLLTLAYSIKGGLRSSILTDGIQMALFGVLLFAILGVLIPEEGSMKAFLNTGTWSMKGGVELLLVALIQMFSYPFHDPVMTDRGFISGKRTTLYAFLLAGVTGFICIILFSFVGIYAGNHGLEGQAPVAVSRTLGTFFMLLVNFIMITSAASTLDSTFFSSGKLVVLDWLDIRKATVNKGRWAMGIAAFAGSIPLLFSPEILSATTISGTMVIGLAPVFLLWNLPGNKWSFYLPFWCGIILGLLLTFGWIPGEILFSKGKYAELLMVNVYGTVLCFLLYFFPAWVKKSLIKREKWK